MCRHTCLKYRVFRFNHSVVFDAGTVKIFFRVDEIIHMSMAHSETTSIRSDKLFFKIESVNIVSKD
jgi:hypothetical protein